MSIIEETLNRLSEERAKQPSTGLESSQSERDAQQGSAPAAELPGDTFNALPWSASQTRTQSGKMSRLPIYVVFFAIIVSAAAWFGIQFLESSGTKDGVKLAKVTEEAPAPVTVAPPAAPEPVAEPAAPVAVVPEAPAEVAAPVVSAPVAPPPVAVEPAPLPVAPAPVVTPAVVAAVPAATPPVAVKSAPAEAAVSPPSTPAPVAKVPSEKPAAVSTVDTAPVNAKAVATEVDASLPSWVSEGRRLLNAKDVSGALKAWNAGFSALPADQRIVAVAAFYDQSVALAALKRLDGFDNAMVVTGHYAGRSAWYLLLHSKPESRQSDLARAIVLTGVKGGAVTGAARLSQIVPVPDQGTQPSGKNAVAASGKEVQETPKLVVKAPTAEPPESKEPAVVAAKKEAAAVVPKKEAREAVDTANSTAPTMNVLYESQLEQVAKAFNSGSYKEAEELARTTLDQNAKSAGAWLWVGKTVLARGQFDDAERHLARATEISPNLAEAWTLRGIVAQETGNHTQALKYFSETLRLQPNQAEAYFNIGYSHDALGNRNEAEANWRRFLDVAKDKPRYAKQRVYVEQHLGAAIRQE